MCELDRREAVAAVYVAASCELRTCDCDCVSCDFFCRRGAFVVAGAVANHPCHADATRLGAKAGRAVAAGVICASPRRDFFF
jgi:hypothetical protein